MNVPWDKSIAGLQIGSSVLGKENYPTVEENDQACWARTTIARWNKTIEHTVQVQLSHGEMKRSSVPCEDNYRVEEEGKGEIPYYALVSWVGANYSPIRKWSSVEWSS